MFTRPGIIHELLPSTRMKKVTLSSPQRVVHHPEGTFEKNNIFPVHWLKRDYHL
jgi:hypothetical protein